VPRMVDSSFQRSHTACAERARDNPRVLPRLRAKTAKRRRGGSDVERAQNDGQVSHSGLIPGDCENSFVHESKYMYKCSCAAHARRAPRLSCSASDIPHVDLLFLTGRSRKGTDPQDGKRRGTASPRIPAHPVAGRRRPVRWPAWRRAKSGPWPIFNGGHCMGQVWRSAIPSR